MSKKLREQCGYSTAEQKTCSNCAAFTFTTELPEWMKSSNLERAEVGLGPRYFLARHGQQKNLRCGDHGFAVTKRARCNDWRQKED